jgi:hypothetical protein
MLRANMATIEAVGGGKPASRPDRFAAWVRWWFAGNALDWGFAALTSALIGAGYYEAWIIRHPPGPVWQHIPTQAAWLAITVYLGAAVLRAWRGDHDRDLGSLIPDGYDLSVLGCGIFLVGIVFNGWWANAFGAALGVPAIFRVPNLLEIAGAGLIVVGPLRAATSRGELMAGPTAVISAVLLLATVTFFTQFDHPYIDQYAGVGHAPLPSPQSTFDIFFRDEILGALGLLMQTAAVTGVILWVLRRTRLPIGSITLMLTVTSFLAATQLGHFSMVLVGLIVGVLGDIALVLARPRADRVIGIRLFSITIGVLLSAVYLTYIRLGPGVWWSADMSFGTVFASAIVGGLISYLVFPDADGVVEVLWPALTHESSAEAPEVTVERVEHALKVLHNARDLAESPLIGMRCMVSPTPAELRKTIEGAIEHLRASAFQQDAQAGQILDLYYVRRIGVHYAVWMRVGLSHAAYFNRRSYGVRRLVDRLRELEEPAGSA